MQNTFVYFACSFMAFVAFKQHEIAQCTAKHFSRSISSIYNMSGRVVSDMQTRAKGESLYI